MSDSAEVERQGDPAIEPAADNEAVQRARKRKFLLFAVVAVVLVGALVLYLTTGRYESTDNAYIDAGQVTIRAQVPGTVTAVEVTENQFVHKGDVLVRLDTSAYEATVAQAEAELQKAELDVRAARSSYGEGRSELASAQDKLTFAQRELARQKQLLAEGISSQAQYDQAALAAKEARQAIETIKQRNQGVLAQLAGDPALPVGEQASVKRARAILRQRQIDLGHSVLRAPQDGIVTKVNQVQVGNYATASQPLFTLVGKQIWVEANFKEDQLTHMRIGQPATIKLDAFPDAELTGRVASFSPGTGNTFAILPAENATGNWVKVVQRLPVEIKLNRIPKGVMLHAGLSAEVTVDTQHRRHLFGSAG